MASPQKFLVKCGALKDKNITFEMEQGAVIARGFADLGIEEFVMLGPNKICSLYSGKTSDLPEEEKMRFFAVPNEDMMADKIIKAGYDIESMIFEDQRTWILKTRKAATGEEKLYRAGSIKEVLLECLLNV